jgi:hypothetical protein
MKTTFRELVEKAIKANRAKHPPVRSPHEGLALIQEEVFELQTEVYRRRKKDDPFRFLNDLTQIAALCEIMAEDLQQ